ncbi:MAG: regulatory iron-sulfur-containing complex subunit RicT [Oscillospiraceae bacterium]
MEILGVKVGTYDEISYCRSGKQTSVGDIICLKDGNSFKYAKIVVKKQVIDGNKIMHLPAILRVINNKDKLVIKNTEKLIQKALKQCEQFIKKNNLPMHLLDASYSYKENKVTIFFKANERVDFRLLVRELASALRLRIEFRQVSPRIQAKYMGNLGVCGYEVCCKRFLHDFEPISVKKIRGQMPFLNMSKISGVCGRLMCCFKFEPLLDVPDLLATEMVGEALSVRPEESMPATIELQIERSKKAQSVEMKEAQNVRAPKIKRIKKYTRSGEKIKKNKSSRRDNTHKRG